MTDARVVEACDLLLGELDDATRGIAEVIRREEPFYIETMSFQELADAVRPNAIGVLESVKSNETSALAAPRRTGRERAEQGVPLTTVLHAYRLGALYLWDELVRLCADDAEASRALLGSASSLWTALDVYSQELATAYREVQTEQILSDARIREAALAALFSGVTGAGQSIADVAAILRLPRSGRFVVVASDPRLMEQDRELASAEHALASVGVRSAWRSEPDGELGVVVLTTAYSIDRLAGHLGSMSSGRIGLSEIFDAVTDTPRAVQQARLARDAATGSGSVMHFGAARVAALVAASPELSAGIARDVLRGVLDLPAHDRALLLATLRAWFDCGGSSSDAGRQLHCHANTVRYRLGKLSELTGRDLRAPVDAAHLYLAMEADRLLLQPAQVS